MEWKWIYSERRPERYPTFLPSRRGAQMRRTVRWLVAPPLCRALRENTRPAGDTRIGADTSRFPAPLIAKFESVKVKVADFLRQLETSTGSREEGGGAGGGVVKVGGSAALMVELAARTNLWGFGSRAGSSPALPPERSPSGNRTPSGKRPGTKNGGVVRSPGSIKLQESGESQHVLSRPRKRSSPKPGRTGERGASTSLGTFGAARRSKETLGRR